MKHRFLLIDTIGHDIIECFHPTPPKLDLMQRLVSARTIGHMSLGGGIDGWLDDDGLLTFDQATQFCAIGRTLIAGMVLVCAHDAEGNSVGLPDFVTRDGLAQNVRFLGDQHAAEVAIQRGDIDRPMTSLGDGRTMKVIWQWQPNVREGSLH